MEGKRGEVRVNENVIEVVVGGRKEKRERKHRVREERKMRGGKIVK